MTVSAADVRTVDQLLSFILDGGQPEYLLFGDTETAERIRTAPHPGAAKALGREVRGFEEQLWTGRRFDLVVTGNLAKFGQHKDLGDFLLATGSKILVEASPRDRIWGTGLAAGDDRATSPEHWPGLNLLGFALMEVRHRLRTEASLSTGAGRGDTHPARARPGTSAFLLRPWLTKVELIACVVTGRQCRRRGRC